MSGAATGVGPAGSPAAGQGGAHGAGQAAATVRRTRRRHVGPALVVGAVLVGIIVAGTLLSFVWTPYDPTLIDAKVPRLLGPSAQHWFGTDSLGRDVFSRILVGSRTTLIVGLVAVGVAAAVGVPLGLLAAMSPRRWVDELVMRVFDVMLAFPALLLAIMFAAVFTRSAALAMLAIGIAGIPSFARVARSGALQVMAQDYVLAARVAGRSGLSIAVRHVLPNIASIAIVQSSVSFALAVLAEAGLSYLGLGTPPPTPSWGLMLFEGQDFLAQHPLLVLFPGGAIATAVLGFNLLGDGLRDLLDPRMEAVR
ncbi:MAG: ABC transporter permease [Austwickia sp.]|jgi:peptide/nickel transport system permease protein|nr:MAG: ABC transporter permease [Austwickia sp.]